MPSPDKIRISIDQARDYLVRLHFSCAESDAAAGICDQDNDDLILVTVRRLGCVQYDPLSVVGRNHDLVLQSRIPGYRPDQLDRVLYGPVPRRLVEGLDKNLSMYPVEDWQHLERMRRRMFVRYGERPAVAAVLPAVRERLEQGGPIGSNDLDFNEKIEWPWGMTRLSRAALEAMWYGGEVILHHREGSRRFYEFTHRLLPAELLYTTSPHLDDEDYFRWHTLRRIHSVGLLRDRPGDAWLGICGYSAAVRGAAFRRLTGEGALAALSIDGLPEAQPYHIAAADLPVLEQAMVEGSANAQTRILAPLDNLIWDRRMIRELFGFDYTWEVYTPVDKRRYGYYVLPVMFGSRFVARFEPERHRPGHPLTIRKWWWEPDAGPDAEMRSAAASALERFARYLGAPGVEMDCPF